MATSKTPDKGNYVAWIAKMVINQGFTNYLAGANFCFRYSPI